MSMYASMAFCVSWNMEIPQDSILLVGDNLFLIAHLILDSLVIGIDMYNRIKLFNIIKNFVEFDDEVGFCIEYMYDNYYTNPCHKCSWPVPEFVSIIKRPLFELETHLNYIESYFDDTLKPTLSTWVLRLEHLPGNSIT